MCPVKPGPRPERGEAVGMGYSARVLLDSVSPGGVRLVTMEVRYPRFIHAEFMTHRMFSRNAGSSRALPIRKMIAAVRDERAAIVRRLARAASPLVPDAAELIRARG